MTPITARTFSSRSATDLRQPGRLLAGGGVLADHLAPHLLLAPGLAVVREGRLQRPQPPAHASAGSGEERREGELRREDERYEQAGGGHDVGPGAVEVGHQQCREHLADGAARPHRLALEADGAERERQQRREREKQEQVADRLGVGRLDRPAPEQLPADEPERDRQQQCREAEQLWDQQLGQERAERPDEVARGGFGARLEEGRRVARVERRERDQQHQRDREGDEPEELGAAIRA